jgi:predicted nucleic acid-binding protein
MFLADTSVWVDHLRRGDPHLAQALVADQVFMHPFVLGEIACGNLPKRASTLSELELLPSARPAEDGEVLKFLEQHRLFGKGIGWIDAHLLASAMLTHCFLWTHDSALARAAFPLGLIPNKS